MKTSARWVLRIGVVLLGLAAGGGFAGLVYFHEVAAAADGKPPCDKCGRRHAVDKVTYIPATFPNEKGTTFAAASARGRVVGIYDDDKPGPEWYCGKCSLPFGRRPAADGR